MSRARAAVPFDPEQDAWHAPTQCVWDAAYVAALIGCVLACSWPVPDDLVELWNWYEARAGHWPTGFVSEPEDQQLTAAERRGFGSTAGGPAA